MIDERKKIRVLLSLIGANYMGKLAEKDVGAVLTISLMKLEFP